MSIPKHHTIHRKRVAFPPSDCFGHYIVKAIECKGCLVNESYLCEKLGDEHL